MKPRHLLATSILALALTATAKADLTIDWGNDPFSTLIASNGTSLFDDSYKMEIGTFNTSSLGGVPTSGNMSLWGSSWTSADTLGAPPDLNGAGLNSGLGYFTGTFTFDSSNHSTNSGSLFGGNEQVYMWIYKGDKTYATGLEWALITNSAWVTPTANTTPNADQWRISDPGTSVVFGGVNNIQSAGDYTAPNMPTVANANDSDSANFEVQTHTLTVSPVPEPGGVLMIGMIGMATLLRRRARA